MIGSLRGTLLERSPKATVVVEVGGVGYEVQVAAPTSAVLGAVGGVVFLHVHTRVREDAITLYGFATGEEKRCFEVLIGAHGVGPAVALALLSVHSPVVLRRIVATDDADSLAQVPGIGKKTAARLLLELRAKFDLSLDDELIDLGPVGGSRSVNSSSVRADVSAALSGLGYSGDEVRSVLAKLPGEGRVEDLLRQALKELASP